MLAAERASARSSRLLERSTPPGLEDCSYPGGPCSFQFLLNLVHHCKYAIVFNNQSFSAIQGILRTRYTAGLVAVLICMSHWRLRPYLMVGIKFNMYEKSTQGRSLDRLRQPRANYYRPLMECLLISSLRLCISSTALSCSLIALAFVRASSSAATSQTAESCILSQSCWSNHERNDLTRLV